ncbi:MAG TPA: glycosyltransferase family 4 protein [Rudaea sp.]|nr:glycosyltransferase family 4 protein [Rudaea sp.]
MDWYSRPYGVAWWGSLAASLALSALVTWLGIRYARHRKLIDQPGRRRSHRAPTPRGGGIGIVAACAVFFVAPLFGVYHGVAGAAAAILTGILAVAAVGWWDDHFGLGAIPRLAVHVLAAGALAFSLLGSDGAVAVAVFALATVWSINLHNFMDGIDGILGAQALFVFAALACLGTHYAQPDYVLPMAAAASATLGFLPFNFPRARVFMGDVGSGTLGFLIAAALGLGLDFGLLVPAQALVIVSTFVIDASCTLASRMWRGRRWYSAHREHLYQWLARRMSHARVVGIYTAWNLLIVAPAMLLLEHMDGHDTLIAAFVYASGITAWALGKRWCLDKVESSRHA